MNQYLRPCNITPDIQARAKEVMAYAFEHRETIKSLRDRMSSFTPPPGLNPDHVLEIPIGYKVAYMVEQDEMGWQEHVSIMVSQPKLSPTPDAVVKILGLFDIHFTDVAKLLINAKKIWEEKVSATHSAQNLTYAVNLDKFKPSTPQYARH